MSEERELFSPAIVTFCCTHSAYQAADRAGQMRLSYPQNIRLIRLPCAGRLGVLHILKAFECGADGVLVLTCPQDSCRHINGNARAEDNVNEANALLSEVGMNGGRVLLFNLGPTMVPKFVQIVNEAMEKIKELGPSPVKGGMR